MSKKVRIDQTQVQPEINPQQQMIQISRSYESLRSLLREERVWTDQEVIDLLQDLAAASLSFAQGLKERRDQDDQNLAARKKPVLINSLAGAF